MEEKGNNLINKIKESINSKFRLYVAIGGIIILGILGVVNISNNPESKNIDFGYINENGIFTINKGLDVNNINNSIIDLNGNIFKVDGLKINNNPVYAIKNFDTNKIYLLKLEKQI